MAGSHSLDDLFARINRDHQHAGQARVHGFLTTRRSRRAPTTLLLRSPAFTVLEGRDVPVAVGNGPRQW
jgi:hypothetical protein